MKRSNMITIGLSSILLISIIGNVVLFKKIENETNGSVTLENQLTTLKDTYIQAQQDVSDIEQKISEVKMSNDSAQEATNNAEIIIPLDPNFKLKSGKTLYEVRVIIDEQQKLFESEGYDKEYVNKLLSQISDEFGVPIETVYQIKLDDEERNAVVTVNTGSNTGSTGGNTQTTPNANDKNGNGVNDAFEEFGDGSVGGGKTTSDDDFQLGMPGDNQTTPYPKTEWDKNGNGLDDQLEEYGDGSVGGGKTTSDDDFQLGMPGDTDGQP